MAAQQEEQKQGLPEAGADDTALGSLPYVVAQLNKHGSNDEVLVLLHRAIYGRDGKAHGRKVRHSIFA